MNGIHASGNWDQAIGQTDIRVPGLYFRRWNSSYNTSLIRALLVCRNQLRCCYFVVFDSQTTFSFLCLYRGNSLYPVTVSSDLKTSFFIFMWFTYLMLCLPSCRIIKEFQMQHQLKLLCIPFPFPGNVVIQELLHLMMVLKLEFMIT